jgi:hypothetical protein
MCKAFLYFRQFFKLLQTGSINMDSVAQNTNPVSNEQNTSEVKNTENTQQSLASVWVRWVAKIIDNTILSFILGIIIILPVSGDFVQLIELGQRVENISSSAEKKYTDMANNASTEDILSGKAEENIIAEGDSDKAKVEKMQ